MSSPDATLLSLLICSCLFAPKREKTLPERDEACEGDLTHRSRLLIDSDPSLENTLLDRDRVGDFRLLFFSHLFFFILEDRDAVTCFRFLAQCFHYSSTSFSHLLAFPYGPFPH
ncbi:hypothetical protein Tco_1226280 [Tanacetum coccineum]